MNFHLVVLPIVDRLSLSSYYIKVEPEVLYVHQAIYIFGFGVPLFADKNKTANGGRWGLWIIHKMLLTAVYGFIFFMHHSKWRERLPGNPHIYALFFLVYCCLYIRLYFFRIFTLPINSKTGILQIRLCNVVVKYNVPIWLSACWKWSWIWDLVSIICFLKP